MTDVNPRVVRAVTRKIAGMQSATDVQRACEALTDGELMWARCSLEDMHHGATKARQEAESYEVKLAVFCHAMDEVLRRRGILEGDADADG